MKINYSILRKTDRSELEDYIDLMNASAEGIMRRKNPIAVYQQAWCLREATITINRLLQERAKVHVVIVGVLDDPIYPALKAVYGNYIDIIICDPVVNQKTSHTLVEEGVIADVVIACSVWEHDPSVTGFLEDLVNLSRDTIILTADFHPAYFGKNIPSTSFRILDEDTLNHCLDHCSITTESKDLSSTDDDLFCWEGCYYYFVKATITQ